MDRDLRALLLDWPFDPDRLNARVLEIEEGRTVLQVRVELGILQMEIEGRPDGGEDVLPCGASVAAVALVPCP